MSSFIEKLLEHRLVAILGISSFLAASGSWAWAWWKLKESPHTLSLHWNNLAHVNLWGDASDLLGIGLFAAVSILTNFMIALELDRRDWFWGKLLSAATLAFAVLIFIGFTAIVSVN